MGNVGRPKGIPKTGGRQKGTTNKLTTSVKEAIEMAFEGIGGVATLKEWARENRTEFFTKVWPKIMPRDINIRDKTLEQILEETNDDETKEA